MTLIEIYNSIKDNSALITFIVAVFLTVIQVTPIKLNPWSSILKMIRKIFIGDLSEKVKDLSDTVGKLSEEVNRLREETEEREAISARIRILRFSDDITNGVAVYSHEHFKQMFDEITRYDHYCSTHPRFRNQLTVESCKNISAVYQEYIKEKKFTSNKLSIQPRRSDRHYDN